MDAPAPWWKAVEFERVPYRHDPGPRWSWRCVRIVTIWCLLNCNGDLSPNPLSLFVLQVFSSIACSKERISPLGRVSSGRRRQVSRRVWSSKSWRMRNDPVWPKFLTVVSPCGGPPLSTVPMFMLGSKSNLTWLEFSCMAKFPLWRSPWFKSSGKFWLQCAFFLLALFPC